MERKDELEAQVRKTSLRERLDECRTRIGKMCSEGRPPRMCIPVQWDDDDFYISTTLADAQRALDALQAQLRQAEGQSQQQAEEAVIVFAKYDGLLEVNQTLRAENARLREAVVWALGYTDFRAREHGEGPYWWRVELRLRSKLTGEQIDATLAALQPERGKP